MGKYFRYLKTPKFAGLTIWLITVLVLLFQPQYPIESDDSQALEVQPVSTPAYKDTQEYRDLIALQTAFIRNAKTIKPLVVSINRVEEVTGNNEKSPSDNSSLFKARPWYAPLTDWLDRNVSKRKFMVENVGSGFIFSSNGHIITNYHVIKELDRILVKMPNGKDYFATVVGNDPMTDIAVIKITSLRRLSTPEYGDSNKMQVGEWVMAIGNPYGLEGTVTVGVISGKSRSDLGIATFENFIQTDASINPGNSGGPLINLDGEIIGINTAVAEIGSGVGFAIPIEMAHRIATQLIDTGTIERGWLGVGIQSMTPELAESFQIQTKDGGVLVSSVNQGAPANRGGIIRGDVIVMYDGEKVLNSTKFQQMVANTSVGKNVDVMVIRDGLEKNLKIKIGKNLL
jgi:S1-C subfamily serine protease